MRNIIILLFVPFLISAQDVGGDYYVAHPDSTYSGMNAASDLNDGSYANPWATWEHAFYEAGAGDTVYFRRGRWQPTDYANPYPGHPAALVYTEPNVRSGATGIGNDGTKNAYVCFFNYPGETPILDGSLVDTTGYTASNSGMILKNHNYIHLKGLRITKIMGLQGGGLGVGIGAQTCSNVIFENLQIDTIGGRGIAYWSYYDYPWLDGGNYPTDGDTSYFINCDIFTCTDSFATTFGNAADGFEIHCGAADASTDEREAVYYIQNCRAWGCHDDGFDMGGSMELHVENCWSFLNGCQQCVEGGGFKISLQQGRPSTEAMDTVQNVSKIVHHCIAAYCGTGGLGMPAAWGPTYDAYQANQRVYNNTLWFNGTYGNDGTGYYESGVSRTEDHVHLGIYRNNLAYGNTDPQPVFVGVSAWYEESHNSWMPTENNASPYNINDTDFSITDGDFITVDSATIVGLLMAERQEDNSLPSVHPIRLDPTSDLIDAGVVNVGGDYVNYPDSLSSGYNWRNNQTLMTPNINVSYSGDAPEIGAYELNAESTAAGGKTGFSGSVFSRYGNLIGRLREE